MGTVPVVVMWPVVQLVVSLSSLFFVACIDTYTAFSLLVRLTAVASPLATALSTELYFIKFDSVNTKISPMITSHNPNPGNQLESDIEKSNTE
jgi:hypothetical protein